MPIIDKIAKAAAFEEIKKRSLEGYGFAMVGSFAKFMEKYVRENIIFLMQK